MSEVQIEPGEYTGNLVWYEGNCPEQVLIELPLPTCPCTIEITDEETEVSYRDSYSSTHYRFERELRFSGYLTAEYTYRVIQDDLEICWFSYTIEYER